ncbi:MAG TPA: aldo/keto reductase [Rhabdochlamydiaceae bacterium]|nr:aldo/keto reductase [Rhabdochlamydiaceae bacterium]
MEFTHIPRLKEKVSRIGLGTWAIGGWMWGGSDENDSINTILHALDSGINLIDTAPAYGFGVSEKIVGKAVKESGKRGQILIATKFGLSWKDPQHVFRDARKTTVLKEVEASLKRLQTDYIDLYQLHWPDPLTPIGETAEALLKLLFDGKIRSIGLSNCSVEQLETFRKIAPLHSIQAPFNLFEREIENEQLAYALKHKLTVLGYSSLCRGLLSGKMSKNRKLKADDFRKTMDPKFAEPRFSQYLKCTKRLEEWAKDKYDKPLIALAIRWVLDKKINIALWGARKPEQLRGLESIFGWHLRESDFEEIDQIIKETVLMPIGPEFMSPPIREKRKVV